MLLEGELKLMRVGIVYDRFRACQRVYAEGRGPQHIHTRLPWHAHSSRLTDGLREWPQHAAPQRRKVRPLDRYCPLRTIEMRSSSDSLPGTGMVR